LKKEYSPRCCVVDPLDAIIGGIWLFGLAQRGHLRTAGTCERRNNVDILIICIIVQNIALYGDRNSL
jgi:hypothetical protein